MFLVNMNEGRIVNDEEIKELISKKYPYSKWLKNLIYLKEIPYNDCPVFLNEEPLEKRKVLFGYTRRYQNNNTSNGKSCQGTNWINGK